MVDKRVFSKRIQNYRDTTFCTGRGLRINSLNQAIEFVNRNGFIFFWPVKEALLPSLWWAHAGDRPVASEHDDPGHETWGWKDESLDKKVWYYAKVLRRRATFISLELIPCFYALSPNFGEPEEDYLFLYEEGKLTQECKLVFEALIKNGPLDTISLRKAARMSNTGIESKFTKALDDLQVDLRILPVGTAEAGAWKYSYVYDLTHRHFPNLIDQARSITMADARKRILCSYYKMVGAVRKQDIQYLFKWRSIDIERSIEKLVEDGLIKLVSFADQPEESYHSLVQLIK